MKRRGTSINPPAGLLILGSLFLAGFAIVHLAGWREHTSFLSLTFRGELDPSTVARYGGTYLVLYLCAVLVAPILAIAAGLLAFWNAFDLRRNKRSRL